MSGLNMEHLMKIGFIIFSTITQITSLCFRMLVGTALALFSNMTLGPQSP
jgi:hypothetical protein